MFSFFHRSFTTYVHWWDLKYKIWKLGQDKSNAIIDISQSQNILLLCFYKIYITFPGNLTCFTFHWIENLYLWYTITSKNKSKLKKAIPLYPSPYFHVSQWVKQRQKLFTVTTAYIVYKSSGLLTRPLWSTQQKFVYWPRDKP